MQNSIKFYKILPHLVGLLVPQNKNAAYSHIYSRDVVEYLEKINIFKKEDLSFTKIKDLLNKAGFQRVATCSDINEFSLKGDILNFWPIGYDHPVRIEFFGEEPEKLYLIDELYNTRIHDLTHVILSSWFIEDKSERESIKLSIKDSELNEKEIIKFIANTSYPHSLENVINTNFTLPPLFYSKVDLLKREIDSLESRGYKVFIKSKNSEFVEKELKKDQYFQLNKITFISNFLNPRSVLELDLAAGFINESEKIALFTDREIFGTIFLTRPEKTEKFSGNIKKLLRLFEGSIEIGDYVVHEDYGIGKYSGLAQESVDGVEMEYLLIKYDQSDELYVPLNQINKITKYIGPEGVEPRITRLGKVSWNNIKHKIKKSTSLLAKELVEHYALREMAKANKIEIKETREYLQFVDEFDYKETEDQLRATSEILSDLEQEKPMDRLLVGDVGFGKTEVIMRAAFKVVENGGQVAVLSPTTVLTAQHNKVFRERFKNFPIEIGFVSRFNTPIENSKVIDEVNKGKIDILIGTHRILSDDVRFKNLKLIVVDEEQRFGVKQKEKIKKLNYSSHLLSVSATPIPRTLSMALSSIQNLSIINTPPVNRKSIKTELVKDSSRSNDLITPINSGWNKIAQAISQEVNRGGQIYFLHNEVSTIHSIKNKLEILLPGIKFGIVHGQMNNNDLDKIMTDFFEKRYDCLISTTIIENGLDIPNVNTIIINNAERFGLSQLYQLRGRVGRGGEQAYCYLLYKGRDLSELEKIEKNKRIKVDYLHRLQSLVENQDLGSGFRIASRDLEIRGAGNLLGEQQSGHISTIGYALYIEILAEEIERLRNAERITH